MSVVADVESGDASRQAGRFMEETMPAVQIIHVDAAAGAERVTVRAEGCMIYVWQRDVPVGQHLDRGETGRTIDVGSLARDLLSRAPPRDDGQGGAGAPADRRPALSASVVICTRDRPDELARCLASFSEQTRKPDEIIVVDNASRDGRTRDVVERAGATYLREDRPGLDFARNSGALAAKGDLVIYTDDDTRLHPRWLERMTAAFDDPSIKAVTGIVLPAELDTPAQVHFETHWSFAKGYERIDFGPDFFSADRVGGCPAWEVGAGASMGFRREIFETVGLFDERLDVGQAGCSGDSEFWHRILSHGGICRYEPSAVVFHYHRRETAALASQLFYYMRGHSAALLVQFERSGNWGNLRRALVHMPRWYLRRLARRVVKGRSERDLFLRSELLGYASGLLFYLRRPRPRAKGPTP